MKENILKQGEETLDKLSKDKLIEHILNTKDIEKVGLIVRGFTQLEFSKIDHEEDVKNKTTS